MIALVAGCESGTEIAGVSRATVGRGADRSVVVTATLDCVLVAGMPRADGNCDADDTRVCVHASWFRASEPKPGDPSSHPVVETDLCQTVQHIRGATVTVPFTRLPDDAQTVLVSTSDQHRAKDVALRRGIVVTR